MNTFLWTLTVVGAWNAIKMISRIYYKVIWTPYAWHVITGIWAAFILFKQ